MGPNVIFVEGNSLKYCGNLPKLEIALSDIHSYFEPIINIDYERNSKFFLSLNQTKRINIKTHLRSDTRQ